MPRADQLRKGDKGVPSPRILEHAKRIAAMPPINIVDADEVHARIVDYFTLCTQFEVKPTLANLALALHLSRRQLANMKNLLTDVGDELSQAYNMINGLMESYLMEGTVNPLSGMFIMKNNFGYKDTSEQVVVKEVSTKTDMKKLEEKYLNAIPELPIDGEFKVITEEKEKVKVENASENSDT